MRRIFFRDSWMTNVRAVSDSSHIWMRSIDLNKNFVGKTLTSNEIFPLKKLILGKDKACDTVRFMGTVKRRVPSGKPGNVKPLSTFWAKFWHSHAWPKSVDRESFIPFNYGTVGGSWDFNFEHIKKFMRKVKYNISIYRLFEIYRYYGEELKLPVIKNLIKEEMRDVRIKKTAYTGLISSDVLKGKRKGSTTNEITLAAEMLWDILDNKLFVDKSLWTFGSRIRRERNLFSVSNDQPAQCRAIGMAEAVPTLLGMNYVSALSRKMTDENESCIMIGASSASCGYIRMRRPHSEYDNAIEGDIASHDVCVRQEHSIFAMSVLRTCFPEGVGHDNRFFFMLSSLIRTNVVFPGGLIFQFRHGNPSGSPWTSWVSSLATWVAIRDALEAASTSPRSYLRENTRVEVGGDDFLVFLKGGVEVDSTIFRSHLADFHGFTIREDEYKEYETFNGDSRDSLTFYKTTFPFGLPSINLKDAEKRLALPERRPETIDKAIEHCMDQMVTGCFDDESLDLVVSYYTFLMFIVFNKREPQANNIQDDVLMASLRNVGYAFASHGFERTILRCRSPDAPLTEGKWDRLSERMIVFDAQLARDTDPSLVLRLLILTVPGVKQLLTTRRP